MPQAGVTLSASGANVDFTETDNNGRFQFTELEYGDYCVRLPALPEEVDMPTHEQCVSFTSNHRERQVNFVGRLHRTSAITGNVLLEAWYPGDTDALAGHVRDLFGIGLRKPGPSSTTWRATTSGSQRSLLRSSDGVSEDPGGMSSGRRQQEQARRRNVIGETLNPPGNES